MGIEYDFEKIRIDGPVDLRSWKERMLDRCRKDTEYTRDNPYVSPYTDQEFLESVKDIHRPFVKRKFIISKKGLKEIKERKKKCIKSQK